MTSNELEIFKQSILDDVRVMMQTTGQVTQYIGARYVPLFADPLEWSNTKEYEPLTIVLHQGNSYTSRQFVPRGIDISNTEFWANTGNYNAQIEQYRQEVIKFDTRISANTSEIETVSLVANNALKTANEAKGVTDKNIIVIFGDSWTAARQGENTTLINSFKNNVAKSGYEIKNYGESGAGFVNRSQYARMTFIDEINTFIADNSYDKSRVKSVLIIGGCNDIYHGYEQSVISTAVSATIDKLESAIKAPYFYLPNVTTPGCIWNYGIASSFFQGDPRLAESLNYIDMFLMHCKDGIFADSRHLTASAQSNLGKKLGNLYSNGRFHNFYTRLWDHMGVFESNVSAILAFSPSSDLVITFTTPSTSTTIATFKETSPFVAPSSDSPEYKEGIPAIKFKATVIYQDNSSEQMTAFIAKPNSLVLSNTPSKNVKQVILNLIKSSIRQIF